MRFEDRKQLPPMAPAYTQDAAATVRVREKEILAAKRQEKRRLEALIDEIHRTRESRDRTRTITAMAKEVEEEASSPSPATQTAQDLPPHPEQEREKPKAAKPKSKIIVKKTVKREVVQAQEERVVKQVRFDDYIEALTSWHSDVNAAKEATEMRLQELLEKQKELEQLVAGNQNYAALSAVVMDKDKVREAIALIEAQNQELREYIANAETDAAALNKEGAKGEKKLNAGRAQNAEMKTLLETLCGEVDALESGFASENAQLEQLEADRARLKEEVTQIQHEIDTAAERHQAKITAATVEYRNEEQRRRVLYNELQELKGNIRVYCRMKPRDDDELVDCVTKEDDMTVAIFDENTGRGAKYEFDLVLGEESTQEQVFAEVQPLALSILDGYHVCIFAYGQTGSGKTFTMEGPPSNRGVNIRAVSELFKSIGERSEEYDYTVHVSVLEVYLDKVYDLQNKRTEVPVRVLKQDVHLEGLTRIDVHSTEDVVSALQTAYKSRQVTGTASNAHSSRSHCVVSLYTTGVNKTSQQRIVGKLHMIDLAGSERVKK
eukprot:PhM_4_TR14149/c1_g1_i2/m.104232/K10406/KIFC2_3; kinesin family member C2/C3